MKGLIPATPEPFCFDSSVSALLMIDMQRDFLDEGGFGAALGNDVSQLARVIAPCEKLLAWARAASLLVIHTREGHRPDLADVPARKLNPSRTLNIGDAGPLGRILVRGEAGHQLVEALAPLAGEAIVDKPGKGAFYATDLDAVLRARGVQSLIVAGVTTEVCVSSTVREAADRGYRCLVLEDCCGSYFPEFHESALAMLAAQGGIFAAVTSLQPLVEATSDAEMDE